MRRELCSAERLSDAAIFLALVCLKTPRFRSSASLSCVTRCDQRLGDDFFAVVLRLLLRAVGAGGVADLGGGVVKTCRQAGCFEGVQPAARRFRVLRGRRELTDLVQKECAAVGLFKTPGVDERDSPQDGAFVATLIPTGAARCDQALRLVEAKRRGGDSVSVRDLTDRERASFGRPWRRSLWQSGCLSQ